MKTVKHILFLLFLIFVFSCGNRENISENFSAQLDTLDALQKISFLNEKIKQNPNGASLYYERAKLHFEGKDIESSLNDINRALKLDSEKTDFYLLLADIYFTKRESRLAKEALNKSIELDPEKTEAFLKLAEIYFLIEQYGKSIEYINDALKIDKFNAKAYFMKGMNYKYSGDTAKAISSMQTAVEQNNEYYDAYIQLGLMYGAKHDSIAVYYFDNALKIQPQSPEALYAKALFLQEHGKPETAIEIYDKMIELDTNNFIAHFNTGYVYLAYLEKFPEAKNHFTKAIELKPDYYEAYCNRGIAYEKMKDFKNAEADFRKSLAIKPDFTLAAKGISRVVDNDFR